MSSQRARGPGLRSGGEGGDSGNKLWQVTHKNTWEQRSTVWCRDKLLLTHTRRFVHMQAKCNFHRTSPNQQMFSILTARPHIRSHTHPYTQRSYAAFTTSHRHLEGFIRAKAIQYGQICCFSTKRCSIHLPCVGPLYLQLWSCVWSVGGHATGNMNVSDEMLRIFVS